MNKGRKNERNQQAYRQMKDLLAANYPKGQFVAICEGQVIADAAELKDLVALVRNQGKDPKQVLAVEAGVDYIEHGYILTVD